MGKKEEAIKYFELAMKKAWMGIRPVIQSRRLRKNAGIKNV